MPSELLHFSFVKVLCSIGLMRQKHAINFPLNALILNPFKLKPKGHEVLFPDFKNKT